MSRIVDTILLEDMQEDDDLDFQFSIPVSEEAIDTLMGYDEDTNTFDIESNELFPQPYDPEKMIDEIGVEV